MLQVDLIDAYINHRNTLLKGTADSSRFTFYTDSQLEGFVPTYQSPPDDDHDSVEIALDRRFSKPIDVSIRLALKNIGYLFDKHLEETLDKLLSDLLYDRFHIKHKDLDKLFSICNTVIKFLKAKPKEFFCLNIPKCSKIYFGASLKCLVIKGCRPSQSRVFIKSLVYKVVLRCLYIKKWLWGFKPRLRNLLFMLSLISKFSALDSSSRSLWQNVTFTGGSAPVYKVSLALAHLFDGTGDKDYWLSRLCWRGFDRKYVSALLDALVIVNAIKLSGKWTQECTELKAALSASFNEAWYIECKSGRFKERFPLALKLYNLLNEEMLFQYVPPVYCFYMYNLLNDGPMHVLSCGANFQYALYILFVCKSILYRSTNLSKGQEIWTLIQLVHHWLTYNRIGVGFLPCSNAFYCATCTCQFTRLFVELQRFLTLLRSINVHSNYIHLIKAVVLWEINRMKLLFTAGLPDEPCTFDSVDLGSIQNNHDRFLQLGHAHVLIRKQCLELCANMDTIYDVRLSASETYRKCPLYLKLTVLVNSLLPSTTRVKISASKTTKMSFLMLLDSITSINFGLEPTIFKDHYSHVASIYLDNWKFSDYLEQLTITNRLNIIERTQACLRLSRDPKAIYSILPQLVHAIEVDPGHRIFNLLCISTCNDAIREQMPLALSGLIYQNTGSLLHSKVQLFMQLLTRRLDGRQKEQLESQVAFHSKMLALSLDLLKVPPEQRLQELRNRVKDCLGTIGTFGLYIDLDDLDNVCNADVAASKAGKRRMVSNIDLDGLVVLKSATRVPFVIPFVLDNGQVTSYIYKIDDDLRQDNLVIQVKWFMSRFFKQHCLDAYLCTFLALPCSNAMGDLLQYSVEHPSSGALDLKPLPDSPKMGGIIGFIPGTSSRHTIGKDYQCSLEQFYELKFGPVGSSRYKAALTNFVKSLAGYSLLCFLLQIKDRHNANLLISSEGHIIHIDYGFILGASPGGDVTWEQAPFKLTREMVDLMGGTDSPYFTAFVEVVVKAFLVIREHAHVFIKLVSLLEHSQIACFKRSTVKKLQKRLCLDVGNAQAKAFMLKRVHLALRSKTTTIYDFVQGIQQGIKH